ncbi:MAG: 30S ribosomal protein S15 [Flavobacteriales bacterium]|nr:30S ribosomal protein S15 [Flavobacteriales bacterium]
MYLTKEIKRELFKKHGGSDMNTGAAESQIALFTHRIAHLTEHLKQNKKDHGTEMALINLVGKRKQLLNYLRTHDITRYRAILQELGLRK